MTAHHHTRVVLNHIRELGVGAILDDDGDIIATADGTTVVVSVNDHYVHARVLFQTAAPVNALAVVARKLHLRLIVGRFVYPDDGGVFVIDCTHRYEGVPSAFDSSVPVRAVIEVTAVAAQIANELGYQL